MENEVIEEIVINEENPLEEVEIQEKVGEE